MEIVDHSQTGEQSAILRTLGYGIDAAFFALAKATDKQRWLDIGAWHPTQFSNTRALWELGWSGICIEPSPGPVQNLVREYGAPDSRVKVIAAAVTCLGGLLDMEVTDDAVSQTPGERLEPWRATGGFYGRLTVPSISVADLFTQFGGDFQFVNIDIEGSSVDVFAAMLAIGVRPRCVCVEHDSRFVELSNHAQAANYRMVLETANNRVYEWGGG